MDISKSLPPLFSINYEHLASISKKLDDYKRFEEYKIIDDKLVHKRPKFYKYEYNGHCFYYNEESKIITNSGGIELDAVSLKRIGFTDEQIKINNNALKIIND